MTLPYTFTILEWGRYMVPGMMPGDVIKVYIVAGYIIVILCAIAYKTRKDRIAKETVIIKMKAKNKG